MMRKICDLELLSKFVTFDNNSNAVVLNVVRFKLTALSLKFKTDSHLPYYFKSFNLLD